MSHKMSNDTVQIRKCPRCKGELIVAFNMLTEYPANAFYGNNIHYATDCGNVLKSRFEYVRCKSCKTQWSSAIKLYSEVAESI